LIPLIRLAEEHGTLGHLINGLSELGENAVPKEVRKTQLERHRAQVFSTMRMTAELVRLLELFASKDIPALVVKGPVLAMQAYGDPCDAQLRRPGFARPSARYPAPKAPRRSPEFRAFK
jgi:hypothetical protein